MHDYANPMQIQSVIINDTYDNAVHSKMMIVMINFCLETFNIVNI